VNERLLRVGVQQLAVVEDGPADGEPLLLIMGLGLQLTAWPEGLVQAWAERGFRVIRYDHRDIGHSSPQDHLPTPSLPVNALRYAMRLPVHAPYTLAELADDAALLLDALGIVQAQVLGVSMGGMVAQHLARRHPQRVTRLHLWMTTSGARHLPWPSLALRRLMASRPRGVAAAQTHYVRLFQALAGSGYPTPLAELQAKVAASSARAWRPQATLRQLLAIAADGDRSAWLRGLPVPTQIVHGGNDPMLPVPHAQHLAHTLPGASLEVIPGWGHDLPAALLPRLSASVPRTSTSASTSAARPEAGA
jgi:pimeloyl-ACP methyl ester carboxylesterase